MKDDFDEAETARRMDAAIRRALNTPPTPTKELVGKGERAASRRESRVKNPPPTKPKNP